MLAAVLTVSGPWLPKRWRRVWWALLLLFAPIHLVVSSIVPARSMLGLAVGYLVGAIIVLVVGTPALEVPLESAVEALQRLGHRVTAFRVITTAGSGPLILGASRDGEPEMIVELYGQNQRSSGAIRQVSKWLTLRSSESAPAHASLARAVEHRALMGIAVADLDSRRRSRWPSPPSTAGGSSMPGRSPTAPRSRRSGPTTPTSRHPARDAVGLARRTARPPDHARRPARVRDPDRRRPGHVRRLHVRRTGSSEHRYSPTPRNCS